LIRDIGWVDDLIKSISPYVRVRKEDSLLILLPNEAYKLNDTALKIVAFLLEGGSIKQIEKRLASKPEWLEELHYFFCDIGALVKGCLGEGENRRAVDKVPFRVPFSDLPILSEVALTYRCNLRCSFCYASCNCRKNEAGPEMTTREVKKVLKIIREDAQVPSVSFTGGEPTLREDLPELVKFASRGMRVNLITNGTLVTKDLARGLVRAGLKSAQVSLEGPSPEVHDGLTGVAGSFEAALTGIENLKVLGVHIHTNTTINRKNLPHLRDLLRLIKGLGLEKFSMNLVIPAGAASENDSELSVTYTEAAKTIKTLRKEARSLGLKFLWYSPTPLCIFNPIAEGLGNKACAACDGLLSVGPDGSVLPCSSYPESVGNLLREPFRKIWNSNRARYFRYKRFVPYPCSDCLHLDVCTGACPLYWQKHGLAELKSARRWTREGPTLKAKEAEKKDTIQGVTAGGRDASSPA